MRLSLILLFALLTTPCCAQNVVLIVGDDVDWQRDDEQLTPNLDWLAANGARFTNVVTHSICRPSLASLITGKLPHEHGILAHSTATYPRLNTSLLNNFRSAGYEVRIDGGKFWETPATNHADEVGYIEAGGNTVETNYWRKNATRTLDFMRRCRDSETPFFALCCPQNPHLPHTPPQEHLDKFPLNDISVPSWYTGSATTYRTAQQKYLAMLSWFDEYVGLVIGHVRTLGIDDDTLIVYVADNGWATGRMGKSSPYESGTRTQLIIQGAGVTAQSHDQLCEMRDVLPTIMELCGVTIPQGVTGRSLKDLLDGEPLAEPEIVFGFVQGHDQTTALAIYARRNDGLRYVRWLRATGQSDIDNFRIYSHVGPVPTKTLGQEELYDLDSDADEQTDLSTTQTQDLATLRAATAAWWTGLGYTLPPIGSATIYNETAAQFSVVGTWGTGVVGYLGAQRWAEAGDGSRVAKWVVPVTQGKTYAVAITWAEQSNRATNTPIAVVNGNQQTGFTVNQELAPNDFTDVGVGWKSLGQFTAQGGTIEVNVNNNANEYVIADAIRLVEVE